MNKQTTIEAIKQWVIDRNLQTADPRVQMCKFLEEAGELAKAINKGNVEKQKDGIGDTLVTLVCVSMQLGLDFYECMEYAYNEIKDRKGKMINGVFVKEADLPVEAKHVNYPLKETCKCINKEHKVEYDCFPYGDSFEYDECIKCGKHHSFKTIATPQN